MQRISQRHQYISAIFVICKKLELPLTTFYVSGAILHRHWVQIGDYDLITPSPSGGLVVLCSAAVYLACKATEQAQKCGMETVFACAAHLFATSNILSPHSAQIPSSSASPVAAPLVLTSSLRTDLVDCEQRLLRDAAFDLADVTRNLPHVFLLNFARLLGVSAAVVQRAWGVLNDLSLHVCDVIIDHKEDNSAEVGASTARHAVTAVAFAHPSEAVAAACLEVALAEASEMNSGQQDTSHPSEPPNAFSITGTYSSGSDRVARDQWWRAVGVSDKALVAVLAHAKSACTDS